MAGTVSVTDETFPIAVEMQPLVVVDFWAPWCGPCRALGPIVERLAEEYAGRVAFAKLNVDENQATAARFGVQSIPALLFFDQGKVVDRTIGLLPQSILRAKVEQILKTATAAPTAS